MLFILIFNPINHYTAGYTDTSSLVASCCHVYEISLNQTVFVTLGLYANIIILFIISWVSNIKSYV